jgi:hypothetical protein
MKLASARFDARLREAGIAATRVREALNGNAGALSAQEESVLAQIAVETHRDETRLRCSRADAATG